MEDMLGWLSVLIVSTLLLFFDWPTLDPILSIVFTLFIFDKCRQDRSANDEIIHAIGSK
jgi:Co/Zn/Cd efflux system component